MTRSSFPAFRTFFRSMHCRTSTHNTMDPIAARHLSIGHPSKGCAKSFKASKDRTVPQAPIFAEDKSETLQASKAMIITAMPMAVKATTAIVAAETMTAAASNDSDKTIIAITVVTGLKTVVVDMTAENDEKTVGKTIATKIAGNVNEITIAPMR